MGNKINLTALRGIVDEKISGIFLVTQYERLTSYIYDAILEKICHAAYVVSLRNSSYIKSILSRGASNITPWKRSPTSTQYRIITENNFLICAEAIFSNLSSCIRDESQQKVSIFASKNDTFTNSVLYQANADVKLSCDPAETPSVRPQKYIYVSGVRRRINGCILVQPCAQHLLGNFSLNKNTRQMNCSSNLIKDNRKISGNIINIAITTQTLNNPWFFLLFIYKLEVDKDIVREGIRKTVSNSGLLIIER